MKLREGNICPHCKEGRIFLVEELFPWYEDHLQCNQCDSTYMIHSDECPCWVCKKENDKNI